MPNASQFLQIILKPGWEPSGPTARTSFLVIFFNLNTATEWNMVAWRLRGESVTCVGNALWRIYLVFALLQRNSSIKLDTDAAG